MDSNLINTKYCLTAIIVLLITTLLTPAARADRTSIEIGSTDSVYAVELAIHRGTGNLLAVQLSGGFVHPSIATVHHSTDGGQTWSTQVEIIADEIIHDISCVAMNEYFYVVYSGVEFDVIMRRYRASDGQQTDFPVFGETVPVWSLDWHRIELMTTEGYEFIHNLYLVMAHPVHNLVEFRKTILGNPESWTTDNPGTDTYSRGFAGCGGNNNSRAAYFSYIDVADNYRVYRYYPTTGWEIVWGPQGVMSTAPDQTAITSTGDTVTFVTEHSANPINITLKYSDDLGENWLSDYTEETSNSVVNPALTCYGGGGIGMIYTELSGLLSSTGRFGYRPCAEMPLMKLREHKAFTESGEKASSSTRPDIEYLGSGYFGIVWANSPTAGNSAYYTVTSCCTLRGDMNDDGEGPDISDLVYLVTYMFQNGPEPWCLADADVNGDMAGPDISDLVYLVTYMFQQGPPLVPCE